MGVTDGCNANECNSYMGVIDECNVGVLMSGLEC